MIDTQLSEEAMEVLASITKHEIDACESYLDEEIRPTLQENYEYFNQKLPKPSPNGSSLVDNTCKSVVKHFVASAKDAFVSGDLLEVIPDDMASAQVIEVATELMNDILDRENNRGMLYTGMFKDAAIAKVGILKPYVYLDEEILRAPFKDVPEDELMMIHEALDEQGYEVLQDTITDEREDVSQFMMPGVEVPLTAIRVLVSGYTSYKAVRQTIRIDSIPPENFLINNDARDVRSARIVGHKNNVTISELIGMGFDYDKISEVAEKNADDNDILTGRETTFDTMASESLDKSMREVSLYEVYIRTSLSEVSDEDAEYEECKLYKVFMSNDIVLEASEVNEAPYACGMIDPTPHSFWAESLVDQTKHIQRAKTGLIRQHFTYNALQTSPRFLYRGVDERSMLSKLPGTGIRVDTADGYVTPLQIGQLSGESGNLMGMMDLQREQATGITFTGQGMLGDVLKAGGSSISASMVLSEGQMVIKDAINNMLHSGILPLCSIIYNLIRENIDSYKVTVQGQEVEFNPIEEMPKLREVRIKAPLGSSAKLEKANAYNALFMAATNPQMPLDDPKKVELLARIYEFQDIKDARVFLPTAEEIQQKDMMAQQLQQLSTQMEQMNIQLQQLTMEKQQLQATASEMAQKQLELAERQVIVQETKAQIDGQVKADKQALEEEKAQANMTKDADLVNVKEREQDMKEQQTQYEMKNPDFNLFRL